MKNKLTDRMSFAFAKLKAMRSIAIIAMVAIIGIVMIACEEECTHSYGEWEVSVEGWHNIAANTCGVGEETRKCSECGDTEKRSTPCFGTEGLLINNGVVGYIFNNTMTVVCIPETRNGQSVTSIQNQAFQGNNNLTFVRIGKNVTAIGNSAFNLCTNLETVTFAQDSQLKTIGSDAFSMCNKLKSITTIPASVISIGNQAFAFTALETVTFAQDSQLQTIGERAFSGCLELKSITIPASVTSIGTTAFGACTNLETVTILRTTPPVLGTGVFSGQGGGALPSGFRIEVPMGQGTGGKTIAQNYREASIWSNYADYIFVIPPVIAKSDFYGAWSGSGSSSADVFSEDKYRLIDNYGQAGAEERLAADITLWTPIVNTDNETKDQYPVGYKLDVQITNDPNPANIGITATFNCFISADKQSMIRYNNSGVQTATSNKVQ